MSERSESHHGTWEPRLVSVLNLVLFHHVGQMCRYFTKTSQRITEVGRIQPLVTMNVCTECRDDPSAVSLKQSCGPTCRHRHSESQAANVAENNISNNNKTSHFFPFRYLIRFKLKVEVSPFVDRKVSHISYSAK